MASEFFPIDTTAATYGFEIDRQIRGPQLKIMAVFLFWNLNNKPLYDEVATACREHDVDILILAEAKIQSSDLLHKLNEGASRTYHEPPSLSRKLKFYVRLTRGSFQSLFDDGRAALRLVRPPVGPKILLAAAHLPSKLYAGESDHQLYVSGLVKAIEDTEQALDCFSTIVIGDLNMNPFEPAMVDAHLFHGVMDKAVARTEQRRIAGRQWRYFYNPMWSRLGDDSAGPPGTYFRSAGETQTFFWNTFDQVLLRPALLPYFESNGLRVLTQIGSVPLIRNDRIDVNLSDHLPIVLRLDLEREISNG